MKKTYYNYLLTISLIGLIVSFALGIYWMHMRTLHFQQNAIGALYQADKGLSEEYLHAMFGKISAENIAASQNAFEEFGFTDQGLTYLGKRIGIAKMGVWFGLAELLILGLIFVVFYQKSRLWKKEKQELNARIWELQQTQMQDDYVQKQNRRIQNFIENIAHQIKTPISRVFSSLYMIEEGIEDENKKGRINECYSHLDSVNTLMKRLMDIGKLEAGKVLFKKEKIEFEELLKDVIHSCADDRENINLSLVPDAGEESEGEYYGDYELLKEAFMNILNNALEHDKSGKPLEIRCGWNSEQVKVSFRDHGPGLCEKDIPNLFDRFYLPEEAKATHTGIGLNLAKLIFEGHFGTIYVYNHAEGGAVFNVVLPRYSLKVRI